MTDFQAGFGRIEITPQHLGYSLLGYGNRQHGATAVHDPLWARAMVVRQKRAAWALCSLDMCWVTAETVARIRQLVSEQTKLRPEAVLIVATHTHSGPSDLEAGNWDRPLAELVTAAIVQAWEGLQPARLATGAGFLYGHSLNRRWFERPVDPGVGLLRVDSAEGALLGQVVNFGCHPVVLGSDNYQLSADFVGYGLERVEKSLGGVCLFTNGACGDINPLTDTVRAQLAERRSFTTMVPDVRYYGQDERPVSIGDRQGGTFVEAKHLGEALADEVIYIAQGLTATEPERPPWSAQAQVNHVDQGEELIETQAVGVGDFALVAQPGEVFVETGLEIKANLRRRGYRYPWLVSYANDWQLYLAPEVAFPEGGYEVNRAEEMNHSPQLQARLWGAIEDKLPGA